MHLPFLNKVSFLLFQPSCFARNFLGHYIATMNLHFTNDSTVATNSVILRNIALCKG